MSAHVFSRSALGFAAVIVILTGCGGGTSTSTARSLPVAAQFTLNLTNSVVYRSTPSSISFQISDWTRNCLQFPRPFSDDHLNYNDSAQRTVQLVDCGTSGWFTVTFHALDVSLADTTVKWTVSEPGLSESVVTQGGLCIQQTRGLLETVIAKPPSGCPAH
jgi:hypothetical protein